MDYTCAWERAFGLRLRQMPSWLRRRIEFHSPDGQADMVRVVDLSCRAQVALRRVALLETTQQVRRRRRAA